MIVVFKSLMMLLYDVQQVIQLLCWIRQHLTGEINVLSTVKTLLYVCCSSKKIIENDSY